MPSALEIYRGLCEDLASPELRALKAGVRAHYAALVDAQQRNELIPIDLAEALCLRLETLLAGAHLLDAGARARVVGAARYFVAASDAKPDDQSCTGLDDDVEVFNHVVDLIDRPDLAIND